MSNDPRLELGATVIDGGVNFAVHSSVADRVELCLLSASGKQQCFDLPHRDGDTWHGYVAGIGAGQRYGFRVHGPWDPAAGNFCNPAKLLIDPYARRIDGELRWSDALDAHSPLDSADFVPKSVVCQPLAAARPGPRAELSKSLIYELNVRGYTMRHPDVAPADRGKFLGLSSDSVLKHIRSLGITAVELMPIHAFVDEQHLAEKGLRNYWGYNTLGFFAPAQRYGGDDPVGEFRQMVDVLHDANLEVILDVVYNHTAEGGAHGPMLSFRGFDNLSYYRMQADDPGAYVNDTGCGNTINADQPAVQRLILDNLRYWTGTMGVDGFRFDLAPILGRHADGYSSSHRLLAAISNDPVLSGVKLIAEPWDPGPGGYQLGAFPPPWLEWNDRFRDTARRYWRGDAGQSAAMAQHLRGSAENFSNRGPLASVNFVTSHDGYTLSDVSSYERRHNEANGEQNRDGHSHNFSCNFGVEGDTDDKQILANRRQHRLNLLASVLLAQGTPMLLAGDELGHSQGGNNNAYAQDNETTWLDWSAIDAGFLADVRRLTALRRDCPLLRAPHHIHGGLGTGDTDLNIIWFNPDGSERDDGDWGLGHALGLLLTRRLVDRHSDSGGSMDRHNDGIALLLNAWHEPLDFRLPPDTPGDWTAEFCSAPVEPRTAAAGINVPGRAIRVFRRTTSRK